MFLICVPSKERKRERRDLCVAGRRLVDCLRARLSVSSLDNCRLLLPASMDDPLSRALREEHEPSPDADLPETSSSLSISHSQQDWNLPSLNRPEEEAEIHREQIQIVVSDPKKHKSNLDSFITYLITTRTFNDAVQISESNVRRRYNDFVWLKNLLDSKYPFNILSPLPIKHTLSKKFHVVADDGEFIRRRMNGKEEHLPGDR